MSADSDDSKKKPLTSNANPNQTGAADDGRMRNAASGSSSADYEVGYRKPPRKTQFQKGKSGNPRGRPRKVKAKQKKYKLSDFNSDTFFEDEIYRYVPAMENGVPTEILVAKAAERKLISIGLAGNRLALQHSLKRLRKKERKHVKLKFKIFHRLKKLKAEGEATLARAKEEGKESPKLLPHPDDIELNDITYEATVNGPQTQSQYDRIVYFTRLRDYFVCHSLRHRGISRLREIDTNGEETISLGWFLGLDLDRHTIPKRLHLNTSAILDLDTRARAPKRVWQKDMAKEKAWLDANCRLEDPEMPKETIQLFKTFFHSDLGKAMFKTGRRSDGKGGIRET